MLPFFFEFLLNAVWFKILFVDYTSSKATSCLLKIPNLIPSVELFVEFVYVVNIGPISFFI